MSNPQHDREYYEKFTEDKDYELSPIADKIIKALERSDGYCPCKVSRLTGDAKTDEFLLCPCTEHANEIAEMGRCCCNLFVKK